jgi:hypothetical protein
VVDHFLDRASQRDNIASKVHKVYETKKEEFNEDKSPNILNEPMPEFIDGAKLIPDETFVLVGYSSSEARSKWYKEKKVYNFRMDNDDGSLVLDHQTVDAKYLLLREHGFETASKIFRITSKGPKVYSKEKLAKMKYPFSTKPKDFYLIIDIKEQDPTDFNNISWKYKELEKYKQTIAEHPNSHKWPGLPFTVTLTELMKVVDK